MDFWWNAKVFPTNFSLCAILSANMYSQSYFHADQNRKTFQYNPINHKTFLPRIFCSLRYYVLIIKSRYQAILIFWFNMFQS